MKVSVVTCTQGRERRLPGLHAVYAHQGHEAREWLVFDDSPQPSPYLAGLPAGSLQLLHSATPVLMGDKRNALVERAQGDVVAFFDDDDFYAPHYLQSMLRDLGDADMVKLVGWYNLYGPTRELFYWDASRIDFMHWELREGAPRPTSGALLPAGFVDRNENGFGFSYVVRRHVFEKVRFRSKGFDEDYDFLKDVLAAGFRVHKIHDVDARVAHVVHPRTTSVSFPQFRLPDAAKRALFPMIESYETLIGGF